MKKISLSKLFTYNWPIKLTCLLIAIGFWTYVSSTGVKVDNFPGGVVLEMQNIPEGMIAITDINNIDLRIVAEKNVWSKLSSDSVKAYVDLAGLPAGTHERAIKIQINVEGVEVADYSPQLVLIRLEPKVTKNIPVNVKIEGNAGEGLVSGVPDVIPEEVEISGAKSIIEKILEANAIVRLDGETENINKTVKLIALNAENEKLTGIIFTPEEVNISIPIIKAESTKTVGIKVVTQGDLPNNYWISNIQTSPSTITITGSSSILKSLNHIETRSINVENLNKNLNTNIELNIPTGITLVDQINSINVNIGVSKVDSGKQVNAKIIPKNLLTNLSIKSINPENISVNIQAKSDLLNNTTIDDVKLNLDLSKYSLSGTYPIDITREMFEIKEGISILSFAPSSIKVELENK